MARPARSRADVLLAEVEKLTDRYCALSEAVYGKLEPEPKRRGHKTTGRQRRLDRWLMSDERHL